MEFAKMFSHKEDRLSAILEINQGAGGIESHYWAEMLMRMYTIWSEKHGFLVKKLDYQPGDEVGIKSATLEIEGDFAYGYLKSEIGVHRLVRIPPFDSDGRRYTSFVSIFVYPVVDDTIEINPADLQWDSFGYVVRVYHKPSGIAIVCQHQHDELQNREKALQMLKSRLYQIEVEEQNEASDLVESTQKQIRDYVLHPHPLVKDLRTGVERSDVQHVLDGNLDEFIKAYLMKQSNR
jgi:peptide chain release factor 2